MLGRLHIFSVLMQIVPLSTRGITSQRTSDRFHMPDVLQKSGTVVLALLP